MKAGRAMLLALALCGCGALDRSQAPAETRTAAPAAVAPRSVAEALVAHLAHLRGMNEAALATEAARHRRDTSDAGRLKAALALALNPQSDDREILALVDPIARKDNGDRDARAVAGFLQVIAGERHRMREAAAASGNRLREEHRLHEAQKARADALQQKLDALTDLEKSLSDRPTPSR